MTTPAKAPAPASATPAAAPVKPRETRKFTVAEYYRMAEAGILRPDERVELIEGELIVMPPIGPRHAGKVRRSTHLLAGQAGNRFIVSIQSPVHLGEDSEPEPDVALLRPREDYYESAHPVPADVLLVIEVADSTLAYDREVKVHLYGRAGIPEAWVLNLPEDYLERFAEPGPEGYGRHTVCRRGERLAPVSLPDLELALDDLLPPLPEADPPPLAT